MLRLVNILICGVLVFQLIGCGTILYPERKGQKAGRIDAGVALLDAVGLLFFLIPGVIAFAVDFNNGTIYLPGGRGSLEGNDIKEVKFNPKNSNVADIERIVKNETGLTVKLDQPDMEITKLRSIHAMKEQFAQILPATHERIVLIR